MTCLFHQMLTLMTWLERVMKWLTTTASSTSLTRYWQIKKVATDLLIDDHSCRTCLNWRPIVDSPMFAPSSSMLPPAMHSYRYAGSRLETPRMRSCSHHWSPWIPWLPKGVRSCSLHWRFARAWRHRLVASPLFVRTFVLLFSVQVKS